MEESISSCVGAEALHCDAAATPSSEESGWTVYFEDLLASEEAARKEAGGVRASAPVVVSSATAKGAEKKKMMKRRRRKAGEEDPLEDTAASSPSNVARVDASSLYGMNKESVDGDGSYKVEVWKNIGCEQGSVHCCENNGLSRVDRKAANECTDQLQKRGICLVPLSFFAHHHLV